ncbi:hypothetical protein EJ110_NYTH58301 [Nymphaea thermarum]|nr:hypothetical protein EJ110_NYTH58301 [Nymphaea thermarum]
MPNATRNRPQPKCDHCGMLGHIKSGCYVLHGYPPNHPKATSSTGGSSKHEKVQHEGTSTNNVKVSAVLSQLTEEQVSQLASWLNVDASPAAANLAGKQSFSTHFPWIIDTGALDHMTPHLHLLFNIKILPKHHVINLPNGHQTLVSITGTVYLSSNIQLTDVLYILDFKFNLLSVPKFTKTTNCIVVFLPTCCAFQDPLSRKLIGVGNLSGGLYHLLLPTNSHALFASPSNKTTHIWHMRLGHPSFDKSFSLNENISISKHDSPCDACLKAKFTRLPFPTSTSRESDPFGLIHCYIWGGYATPSHTSAHYFPTIVDDFTRST